MEERRAQSAGRSQGALGFGGGLRYRDRQTLLGHQLAGARRQAERERRQAQVLAPALSILNETLRPVRATSGVAQALVQGRPDRAPGALARGLVENKGPLFGQVLRDAGVPKSVAGPAGFALDVALDPTTYLTFGASSVARQAATKAGAQAQRKALRAGLPKARARELGAVAAKRAVQGKSQTRGASVRFAGREVPGVTRVTARGDELAARAVPGRVKRGAATVARQVSPRVAPAGVGRAQWLAAKSAERESRATRSQLLRRSQEKARLLRLSVKPAEWSQVVRALESGKLRDLPEHLRTPTRELRDEFRYHARVRRQAGVAQGNIRNYFPHLRSDTLEDAGAALPGGRSMKPTSTRKRSDRRSVAAINAERRAAGEVELSTNVPLVAANYGAETAGAVATSQVVRELAEVGRKLAPDTRIADGESVYRVVGGKRPVKLDPKTDGKEIARAARGPAQSRVPEARKAAQKAAAKAKAAGKAPAEIKRAAERAYRKKLKSAPGGRYVVLPDRVVDDALGRLTDGRSETGRFFDQVQGKWKRLATSTPGFHIRNMAGDTQMAYLAQPGQKLPANTAAATRALARQTARERVARMGFRPAAKTDKAIKVAGERVNLDDFLDDAVKHGVIRSGQVGRELEEFRHGQSATSAKFRNRDVKSGKFITAGRALNRAFQNREDIMRLSTYKHGLEQGLSKREATDLAMAFHIDYGDVTQFERVFARRAAPFWTFTARALPMHVRALVQKPGKFANLEKARQETAEAFGLDPGWQGDLPEYKQRAIPFGIKVGGKEVALDAALPINLLNELPVTTSLGEYGAELRKFLLGMTTPFLKIPYETEANRSLFFRRDIENEEYPLVSAPSWATKLPKALRERLGIVPDLVDRRSGKKVPGWPGRVDYYFKSVPGLPYLFNQLATEGSLRSGREGWMKAPSALGIKTDPIDPVTTRIFALLDKSRELSSKINALGQRGHKGGRSAQNPTVRALHASLDAVDLEIYKLSVKRKDAMPLRESQVPKRVRRATGVRAGAGGGFDFSTAKPAASGGTFDFSTARPVGR